MANADDIRDRIQSIRAARPDLGTLESIQQAIVSSVIATSMKEELLNEVREIAFFNGIDLSIPTIHSASKVGGAGHFEKALTYTDRFR